MVAPDGQRSASTVGKQVGPQSVEADLEFDVARIARLVLNAQALYERMAAAPAVSGQVLGDRERRLQRLRQAVDLGRRALQVAVGRSLNRRKGDRRARGLGRPAGQA